MDSLCPLNTPLTSPTPVSSPPNSQTIPFRFSHPWSTNPPMVFRVTPKHESLQWPEDSVQSVSLPHHFFGPSPPTFPLAQVAPANSSDTGFLSGPPTQHAWGVYHTWPQTHKHAPAPGPLHSLPLCQECSPLSYLLGLLPHSIRSQFKCHLFKQASPGRPRPALFAEQPSMQNHLLCLFLTRASTSKKGLC